MSIMNNRPGRPRIDPDAPTVMMAVKLPSDLLDAFRDICAREARTMSGTLRRMILRYVKGQIRLKGNRNESQNIDINP